MRTANEIQVSEEEMYKLRVHESHRAQMLQTWWTPAQDKTKRAEKEEKKKRLMQLRPTAVPAKQIHLCMTLKPSFNSRLAGLLMTQTT